jgi:hypothetical protein
MSFISDNYALVLARFNRFAGSGGQDDCWIWRGALRSGKDMSGMYGQLTVKQRKFRPSRVAYELFVGPIPDGMFVLHRCDTPACTNPRHLFVGTAKDNADDMIQKGRQFLKRGEDYPFTKKQILSWVGPGAQDRKGEGNGRSKLTAGDVIEMRQLRAAGETYKKIAKMKGVSWSCARVACCGIQWTHLENY